MKYNKIDFSNEFKTVGLNISYYRKLNGMTQLQLAESVGISRTHISNIEACGMNTSLSLELLFAISYELNIPVYKLLIIPE